MPITRAAANEPSISANTKIAAPITGRTGIRQVDQGNIVHAPDAKGIVVLTQIPSVAEVVGSENT